jgi:response regulator RpfG family c-di-GMP phosphodiesterase
MSVTATQPLAHKGSAKTVMICDDELDVLRAYKIALNSRFNVLTASSGNECLKTYSEAIGSRKKVDAVVLDYRLGDMLGDEVAKKLKEIASTNVILLTAFEIDPSHIDELKKEKIITTFLKKPISLSYLIATINQTIA